MCIDAQGNLARRRSWLRFPPPGVFPVSVGLATGPLPAGPFFLRRVAAAVLAGFRRGASMKSPASIVGYHLFKAEVRRRRARLLRTWAAFEIQGVAGFFLTLLGEAEREESAGAV